VLLLTAPEQDVSVLGETLGAEAGPAALLAALAVGGWAFIGFDTCIAAGEETRDAARAVPRAVWIVVLAVAAIVMLTAVAVTLAHPDLGAAVAGGDTDPVSTAVVAALGDWADRPFAVVVLIAFAACGVAAQGGTARAIYSVARDGTLPASAFLRRVDRRGTPVGGLVAVTVVGLAGLALALEATAIGTLIAFGTAAIYVAFLLVALAALVARLRGTWTPSGPVRMPPVAGLVVNALAVAWLAVEAVNVAWPREALAPPGAPWYQVWAAPLVLTVILGAGAAYLLAARPDRRLGG
jgi:amino acid transporter